MNKKFGAVRKSLILAVALGFAADAQMAMAQGRAADSEQQQQQSGGTVDQQTGRILTEAFEKFGNDDFAGARESLGRLRLDRLSPYERSRVEQIYTSLDVQAEDYAGARQHMEAAIASGGLNEVEASQARYQLAQLWIQEENWTEGAKALEAWLSTATNPSSSAYYLLAIAYYQLEQMDNALDPARKAVELAGETPQEPWLQLLSALLLQREDYPAALDVIKRTLNLYPGRKQYWTQLSSVYSQLEDFQNALVVLEFAHHAGLLTDSAELRRLADMYMLREMPIRAANLLQESMDKGTIEADQRNYEALANSLVAAREFERSLPVLEKAGDLSNDGVLYSRMGEVSLQLEDWDKAVDAFKKALDKGGVRDVPNTQMLMGIAYYEMGDYSNATTWLNRAASDESSRNTSRGYLQLIESKRQN
ncbi:MAG TPA: tetratricopeptide repeat protein [Hyphomicrobiales bacterium]|nr:tetratricopeptide repeat protein [Hyphomicrobiales bacterium]